MSNAPAIRFIAIAEVRRLTGMGTTFIYDQMKKGTFPQQVTLGSRTVRWVEAEVLEWNRQQLEACRSKGLRERAA